MRIIELQRRLREVGRIRIGEQVTTGQGKTRPKKLEHFRLTSRDELVVQAAAEVWGGTAQPWENAPDGPQWEVFTDTDQMSVIIPPGDLAFSQAYEQWSAGGCKVRCDGQRDVIADKPCHCDPEARACDIHTRLSVILPDLPGMGVWRLDTQGYYAAVELGGLVDLIAAYSERGVMLPARLRLEQRSVKRPKPGGGGVETRRFAVPVLDVDVHPLALTAGLNPATGELTGPLVHAPALPAGNLTPVPPVEDGAGAPSIAEQMAQIDQAQPKAGRVNAARPIPPTGVKPRTARDAADGAAAPQLDQDKVEQIRTQLNELGADARRAFLDEFGCPPKELRLEQLDTAVAFVAAMAPFDGPDHPEVLSAPGPDGEGEVGPAGDPEPSTPDPDEDLPPAAGPTFGVKDVARYSTEVFKAEYDAAPRGDKTKVVERLRHALVYAETGDGRTSLNDLTIEELVRVNQRLRDIAEGRMVYDHDAEQVTFVLVGTDTEVTVTWAELDQTEAA